VDLAFVPRSRNQWVAFSGLALCVPLGWPVVCRADRHGVLLFTIVAGRICYWNFFYFPPALESEVWWSMAGTLCWFCQDYSRIGSVSNFSSGAMLMNIQPWVIARLLFTCVVHHADVISLIGQRVADERLL